MFTGKRWTGSEHTEEYRRILCYRERIKDIWRGKHGYGEEKVYQDEYLDTEVGATWTDEETDVKNTDADDYGVFSGEENREDSDEASESIQTLNDPAGHLYFATAEAGEDNESAQADLYGELREYVFGLSVSLHSVSS
ncbi:hypothetical protein FNYG_14771 [Fusarium nygamai]|uniref:Uncharacterized protein n=1 Tax=Gibberella nygamai TaxID=42673 RepID=A0A2K0UQ64_GIBNY|nr:hypothetical protein FNYG_14771 [Fusarium nygamai]